MVEADFDHFASAKHLRNQDRLKNVGAYPNIHYPEVYVLQGGYAEFFKSFPVRAFPSSALERTPSVGAT